MMLEQSYPPLLQGVSQQPDEQRKPGQVSDQLNMLSDPVTGLRRRPGVRFVTADVTGTGPLGTLYTDVVEFGGEVMHLWVDTHRGRIHLWDSRYQQHLYWDNQYVQTTEGAKAIRTTVVGDNLFIGNTAKKPTLNGRGSSGRVGSVGYAYIVAGAFSRRFTLEIAVAGRVTRAFVETPNGQAPGHAAEATPEFIMGKFVEVIRQNAEGRFNVYHSGAYAVFVPTNPNNNVVVRTSIGPGHIKVSDGGVIQSTGDLPAVIPESAPGPITFAVGKDRAYQYYTWDHATSRWLETGDSESPQSISNTPLWITKENEFRLNWGNFEGRLAGDDFTNPSMRWMTQGITGMTGFQGRLVLMSGNTVAFSAADNPRRFFRSTVSTLLESDPIEVGSSAQSSASYHYGVEFNSDLLLFAPGHQATVPSNGVAITPRTATVVGSGRNASHPGVRPCLLERSIVYARSTGPNKFGLMEMTPSTTMESTYTSDDITPHLPAYMIGTPTYMASSNSIPVLVFGSKDNPTVMYVHEYLWDGASKAQAAFHTWQFNWPVDSAYFDGSRVYIVFSANNTRVVGYLDIREASRAGRDSSVYLDLYTSMSTYGGVRLAPDASVVRLNGGSTNGAVCVRSYITDPMRNEQLPDSYMTTGVPVADGEIIQWASVGFRYPSGFAPPVPVVVDREGAPIMTGHRSVIRYVIHTEHTAEYVVGVYPRDVPSGVQPQPLVNRQYGETTFSNGLMLGAVRASARRSDVVPVGRLIDRHTLFVGTQGTHDLRVTGIDYVVNYTTPYRRV